MASGRRTSLIQDVAQASRGALSLSKVGGGWPAEGRIHIGSADAPVRIYTGTIGESHRGRDDERRFQNPGSDKPVELPDTGICLLIGVWHPSNKANDPVVVAMDGYRRAGLRTRFSLFMPAALLHEAAETGYAQHDTQSGETLHAFRASRLSEYLTKVIDLRSANVAWSEKDFGPPPDGAAASSRQAHADGTIHIRPKVGMYAAFARLNYKPWFALAEFLDNAIQSHLTHRTVLPAVPLDVDVRFDDDEIVITDRAAGISLREFPRAFSPSQPPPDASGLSEFGLGMKAAACWFARYWTVRTSAIGDPFERFVRFDVDQITSRDLEHLPIETRASDPDAHYTVVTLRNLRVRPQGRTLGKIKEHLASIYRVLLAKSIVRIRVTTASGSEELTWEGPQLLTAPYFRDLAGQPCLWRTEFDVPLPDGRRVRGWAGLLERGSTASAGFSVFRRDRLIEGSADEPYRPTRLFRNPNSYTYQRLVGELFVEGFDVSHTKDGIQWSGLEDEVLTAIHRALSNDSLAMLAQAEGYRVRQAARSLPRDFGSDAIHGAGAELEAQGTTALIAPLVVVDEAPSEPEPTGRPLLHQHYQIRTSSRGEPFCIRLELVRDGALEWYGCTGSKTEDGHMLTVWINLSHPFSESYVNSDENTLSPLVRLVAALALAEYNARLGGIRGAPAIRKYVNEILRERFGDDRLERVS